MIEVTSFALMCDGKRADKTHRLTKGDWGGVARFSKLRCGKRSSMWISDKPYIFSRSISHTIVGTYRAEKSLVVYLKFTLHCVSYISSGNLRSRRFRSAHSSRCLCLARFSPLFPNWKTKQDGSFWAWNWLQQLPNLATVQRRYHSHRLLAEVQAGMVHL